MLEFIVASHNQGKLNELKELLAELPINILTPADVELDDIAETGITFVENAIIKARHACEETGLPALADDSGLVVDALNGAPGVYSSRYAGPNASDQDRINKVLKELKDVPSNERSASFHCVLAFYEYPGDPAPLICHGIWDGEILTAPQGNRGFGYDPIFYVPDHHCSAAELDPEVKNTISHRGQAMQEFIAILEESLQTVG